MKLITKAFVLHQLPYSDTASIAKLFTEELGMRSYMIRRTQSGKNKNSIKFLQPMALLEILTVDKHNGKLQYLNEIRPYRLYETLYVDPIKMAVLFFIQELLFKAIKELLPNSTLFHYIENSLLELDLKDSTSACFPLHFMLNVAHHLGFQPLNNFDSVKRPYFNLVEGRFHAEGELGSSSLARLESALLSEFVEETFSYKERKRWSRAERTSLFDLLSRYYKVHIEGFANLRSQEVLSDILR